MIDYLKNLFRKKTPVEKAIEKYADMTEDKFKEFAESATDEMLNDFISMLPESHETRINFKKSMWGHTYNVGDERIGKYIWHGYCFHSSMISGPSIRTGQEILVLVKDDSGKERVAIHKILFRKSVHDPHDMYWIYTIGIGYDD